MEISIAVATSGNGLEYFSAVEGLSDLLSLEPLHYGKSGRKLSMLRTIQKAPALARALWRNARLLRRQIKEKRYSAIVIDSDYSLPLVLPWVHCPILAINNADYVVKDFLRKPQISALPQFFVELLDLFFHKAVPHLVFSPTFVPLADKPGLRHIPPLVRDGIEPLHESRKPERIVVMLTGSTFASELGFLEDLPHDGHLRYTVLGRKGKNSAELRFMGKIYDNAEILNEADVLIINGGFSAVSEGIRLRKPMVVIPVEKHAEQLVNARSVDALGLGLMANEATAGAKLQELLLRFSEFKQRHQSLGMPTNGAEIMAQAVSYLE
jgi:uncharacterized protein (TIGR00661 family)